MSAVRLRTLRGRGTNGFFAGNALQLDRVACGSAVVQDLNLFDAALRHAFRNAESFVRIAREYSERAKSAIGFRLNGIGNRITPRFALGLP